MSTDTGAILKSLVANARKLQEAGRLGEAAETYENALALAPSHPALLHALGVVEAKRDRAEEALEHLTAAAKAAPDRPEIWVALANLHINAKRPDEGLQAFDKALALRPSDLRIAANRGIALAKLKRPQEAAEAFRNALKSAPEEPGLWHNLGNVLLQTEDHEGAVEAFSNAVRLAPEDHRLRYALGRAQLWTGEFHASADNLSRAIEAAPHDLQMISFKILALRHAGLHEAADELEGLDDLILRTDLPVPKGFSSLEAFNAALCEELEAHPRLTTEFGDRATRNGAKVDNIFSNDPSPLFKSFEAEVRKAFEATVGRMPKLQGHPLPLSVEGDYTADMWANVMYRGGHQRPHNHPKGWFSGCYYNVLPDRVTQSGDANEGWIEFGGSAYDFPEAPETPKRRIQPEPGMMVVFPSYVFHRTIPFESDEIRVSIAFDAKPHAWRRKGTR